MWLHLCDETLGICKNKSIEAKKICGCLGWGHGTATSVNVVSLPVDTNVTHFGNGCWDSVNKQDTTGHIEGADLWHVDYTLVLKNTIKPQWRESVPWGCQAGDRVHPPQRRWPAGRGERYTRGRGLGLKDVWILLSKSTQAIFSFAQNQCWKKYGRRKQRILRDGSVSKVHEDLCSDNQNPCTHHASMLR